MPYVSYLLNRPYPLTHPPQEMSRLLEADIHRQGLELPESATIRHASALLPYLQHYAAELAAYAQLARAPDEWGFFTPERTVLDLGGNASQRTSPYVSDVA